MKEPLKAFAEIYNQNRKEKEAFYYNHKNQNKLAKIMHKTAKK